jgi:hypothetical protein
LPTGACGKKGPPLPPLQLVPARIDDLVVRRLGDDIYVQFTVTSRNSDGSTPADLRQVHVYGLTGAPVDANGAPLPDREFRRVAELVATVEVRPPPPPQDGETSPAEATPPDPRPAQGSTATATERLAQAVATPWRPAAAPAPPEETAAEVIQRTPLAIPLVSPVVQPPMRYYAVVGENRRGREGELSSRVGVSLADSPPTPPAQRVTYDGSNYVLEWQEPAGVRHAVDAGRKEGMLVGTPVFAGAPTHSYNVYESKPDAAPADSGAPSPLNRAPLPATRFALPGVQFGVERCFVVRTVERGERVTLESAASPPTCVVARDTFAPAAPQNLAAVGGEGAINLIWEASPDADVAGYLVLRSEAAGGELRPVTPEPVRETTYRDAAVRAGIRYAYVVVAVDAATPPNVSAHSNHVEETAR